MLERLIIIHNAIKSGLYPDNLKLQRLYCEQTGYSKVGEATINRDIAKKRKFKNNYIFLYYQIVIINYRIFF